jgi:hypothetical protein
MSRDTAHLIELLKDFDPNKLTTEVIAIGEEWADNDAAASSLEETRKTILAQLQLEYTLEGIATGKGSEKPKPMPASQAEMRALADPRYEQHLELMVQARKEANRCRVRYDMGKMRLELFRSLQATMRQEMHMSRSTT